MNHSDVYTGELDYLPLKHDAADWSDLYADEELEDLEAQDIASELTGRRHEEY